MKAIMSALTLLVLTACQPAGKDSTTPGTSPEGFTGIAADEVISFGGTEPFWGGEVQGESLTYTTPENLDGTSIKVARFVGQGGLGFSGTLEGRSFDMTITPGDCSDGMSDRTYPYIAILQLGEEQLVGCAHTDRQPYRELPVE